MEHSPSPEEGLADERELLERYHRERSPAVQEELVRRFMPLARRLASRYRGGGEPLEDLVQVASVGLVGALERFDPSRGTAFTSFAVPTILGELRRHFRDRGWAIRVPREIQERILRVERTVAEFPPELGRTPTVNEIADKLALSPEEVLEAMEASHAHRALSLDAPQPGEDGEGASLEQRLGESERAFETVEYGEAIAGTLAELPRRDRLVLHLRFVEDLTQAEIARRIGVSQMHISRILRATLDKLRDQVPEDEWG